MTQYEANMKQISNSLELSLWTSEFISMICICILSSAVAPATFLIGTIGCLIHYWTFKLNLLRFSHVMTHYSDQLIMRIMSLTPIIIFPVWIISICLVTSKANVNFDQSQFRSFSIPLFTVITIMVCYMVTTL